MNRERSEWQYFGQITYGIDRNTLPLRTIRYVYTQLPAWRDDPDRIDERSEDKLNLQLCKFLDSCARSDFPMVRFDHEEYQSGQRRVDLSASPVGTTVIGAKPYTIYDPFLVLECKRLPAPSRVREKEYVTGGKAHKSGGIQRFKLGLHGVKLDIAVIVGYVQEHSPSEWHQKINKWILELASGSIEDSCEWSTEEILEQFDEYSSKDVTGYRSIHSRTRYHSSNEIIIFHLWIVMDKG